MPAASFAMTEAVPSVSPASGSSMSAGYVHEERLVPDAIHLSRLCQTVFSWYSKCLFLKKNESAFVDRL
jgi:hypothetical protein